MTAPRKSKENPPIWVSWGSSHHQPSSYGFPWAAQQLANLGTAPCPAPSCSRFRSTAKPPFEKSKIWRRRSVSHWTHQPWREANTSAESKNRPQSMFQHDRKINRCQHPRKIRNPKDPKKSCNLHLAASFPCFSYIYICFRSRKYAQSHPPRCSQATSGPGSKGTWSIPLTRH